MHKLPPFTYLNYCVTICFENRAISFLLIDLLHFFFLCNNVPAFCSTATTPVLYLLFHISPCTCTFIPCLGYVLDTHQGGGVRFREESSGSVWQYMEIEHWDLLFIMPNNHLFCTHKCQGPPIIIDIFKSIYLYTDDFFSRPPSPPHRAY